MLYYIFFILAIGYFLTVARPYMTVVRAGNAHKLLKEGAIAFGLDLVILAASVANVGLWVCEHFGYAQGHLLAMATWGVFAAVAVHRLSEETAAKQDRIATEGTQP